MISSKPLKYWKHIPWRICQLNDFIFFRGLMYWYLLCSFNFNAVWFEIDLQISILNFYFCPWANQSCKNCSIMDVIFASIFTRNVLRASEMPIGRGWPNLGHLRFWSWKAIVCKVWETGRLRTRNQSYWLWGVLAAFLCQCFFIGTFGLQFEFKLNLFVKGEFKPGLNFYSLQWMITRLISMVV